MLRIVADHHNFSLALDDLALFADFLDRRSDFHFVTPPYLERHVMRPLVKS